MFVKLQILSFKNELYEQNFINNLIYAFFIGDVLHSYTKKALIYWDNINNGLIYELIFVIN
ncbi:hypothetical protein GCM10007422_13350 [Pedobacter zeae]|uniref:Uncharacterized protein n=1 Tax=Pedobacter zeae TaxID=1737356 RepID=A0ABQ1XQC2_9SPHI|nr:hypothetical protein GCM10007422_13350 [Pedobacter zeae]